MAEGLKKLFGALLGLATILGTAINLYQFLTEWEPYTQVWFVRILLILFLTGFAIFSFGIIQGSETLARVTAGGYGLVYMLGAFALFVFLAYGHTVQNQFGWGYFMINVLGVTVALILASILLGTAFENDTKVFIIPMGLFGLASILHMAFFTVALSSEVQIISAEDASILQSYFEKNATLLIPSETQVSSNPITGIVKYLLDFLIFVYAGVVTTLCASVIRD